MVRLPLVVAISLLVACKAHHSPAPQPKPTDQRTSDVGQPVARGTLKRSHVTTMYGVAVAAGSRLEDLQKLAHQAAPTLEVTRSTLGELFSDEQLEFLLPRLSDSDAEGLEHSPGVIVLRGSGTDGLKVARQVASAARDVADAAHGWVLDPATFRIYPATEFHEHVPGEHPDIRNLIMVHSIMGDNEQPFLDTAGLHRYGFPELYFSEAATSHLDQITHLLNGVAQALIDGHDVDDRGQISIDFRELGWDLDIIEGGSGKATFSLRWAKERDAGDDDDLVVELVPPGGAGTEAASKLIDECFGVRPDKVTMIEGDDPELIAAAEKARSDLGKLKAHFARGVPPGEQLTVKAKFTDDDGQVEWMWVDVVAFNGSSFQGTLANDPEMITSLRPGQKVHVKLADVADYLHETKGGERSGGYSIEVMRKRGLLPADFDD